MRGFLTSTVAVISAKVTPDTDAKRPKARDPRRR